MPIDPSNIVRLSYEAKAADIAKRIQYFTQDGTEVQRFTYEVAQAMRDIADLVVEMARDVDAKLAALPQTRETFDRRTDSTPGGRNVFGY
jgi:2-C-methyl-D-erythritol 4-phosphate cytidylyltransferase